MNPNDRYWLARERNCCYECGGPATLHARETAASVAGFWWCTRCNHSAFGGNSFQRLTDEQKQTLPRIPVQKDPCWVCGKLAVLENHHLAPRAQFGEEADEWPQVRVCHDCHRRWEDRMGTHARSAF